jgi:hypothetical protein
VHKSDWFFTKNSVNGMSNYTVPKRAFAAPHKGCVAAKFLSP